MHRAKVLVVVQARFGSTRLPGKVLEPILGRPLLLWNLDIARAIDGISDVVVATTTAETDDPLVQLLEDEGIAYHRGSERDVLTRFWETVAPFAPDFMIRLTSDCPLLDPAVISAQSRKCQGDALDYIGIAGWPVGIAGEVVPIRSLEVAYREATSAAEREHVLPFLYSRPDRFRIGKLEPAEPLPPGRFAVDTVEDLAFVRAVAERLGEPRTTSIGELRSILEREPELLDLNRSVVQKHWSDAQSDATQRRGP